MRHKGGFMKLKEFLQNVAEQTKTYIEKYEEYKELNGKQKKARVDDLITHYIETTIDGIGLNFVFKFVLKKLLIENIPNITQIVFDLIKTKVDGITE